MTFLKIVSTAKKYLPIILSGISVAGSVATPILAVKASEKLPEKSSNSPVELWYDIQFDHFFEARETDIL